MDEAEASRMARRVDLPTTSSLEIDCGARIEVATSDRYLDAKCAKWKDWKAYKVSVGRENSVETPTLCVTYFGAQN